MTRIAKGEFTVKLQTLAFEGAEAAARLGRMGIDKQIVGDLQASTRGQMLTAMGEVAGSAVYVAVERVTGTLHGRRGSFALYHQGVMERGTPRQSVKVAPGSGTGELEGIAGDFRIIIEGGRHAYEFTYTLPDGD